LKTLVPAIAIVVPVMLSGCVSNQAASPALSLDTSGENAVMLPDNVALVPTTSTGETYPVLSLAADSAASAGAAVLNTATSAASATTTAVAAASTAVATASTTVAAASVSAVSSAGSAVGAALTPSAYAKADAPRADLDRMIARYAALYDVPEDLVHKVVRRESNYNPAAFNRGHWGLMQIKHATARGMGYDGPARGLLDADTNLRYAVKYLRGAYLVADGDHRRADRLYQTGYYYDAKRKGLLTETGLGKDRMRRRVPEARSTESPTLAPVPAVAAGFPPTPAAPAAVASDVEPAIAAPVNAPAEKGGRVGPAPGRSDAGRGVGPGVGKAGL
jgi:uncharacterized lipoprotein NlpE involved in copper resistance